MRIKYRLMKIPEEIGNQRENNVKSDEKIGQHYFDPIHSVIAILSVSSIFMQT